MRYYQNIFTVYRCVQYCCIVPNAIRKSKYMIKKHSLQAKYKYFMPKILQCFSCNRTDICTKDLFTAGCLDCSYRALGRLPPAE